MRRRVLVTGSSRGIGKEVALSLAKDGFDVVVNCRSGVDSAQSVIEALKALGSDSYLLQFDIADREQVSTVITEDVKEKGAYYGIVCNAGITRDNAFPSITGEDWDQVIHTNLDGFYNVVHPAVMPMIQARKGGRIVAMSSVSGVVGNRGQVNYSASKAGLIGATKALAVELAKRKITVNCVAPGLINTEMLSDELVSEAMKMIPAKRLGEAKEVASLVSYLFSDGAAYLTRQVISVNGGMA
ncbi:3-ketoacyl-ACP reductase FabG2 [Aliikangiella coralliicola]|uniref:3-oxoacyl-ACP reductase FabG n=1 Tax=Aliikangiella coralliicola TaxID=2592383 RepID=A0A545UEF0_9GAMM|nr:3-ketoacyl-ACP reductase FabG2 [Aliikangiella coralliicola]TQV87851.1 3-oxoacyl-ACP reductase FabG [Aliikangiella coralliicola]